MIKYKYTWYEEIDVPSWSSTWFPKAFKEKTILALNKKEAEKKINDYIFVSNRKDKNIKITNLSLES
tara:strand:- start:148 stop:348 length:201 start_codon:yes stop_codon:yes gene_type:complete